ncbi:hypothetical protein HPB49_018030 [Dermacentor silvarum]|uniref:Uncharacterized protein n=1 Tax=Dermacentor silvarum TaxID=543639 RepID=A0ACB8DFE7_DERSI|nr:hypothetical protein HPB49_018030 [Dermacentor silvarum]
MPNKCCVPRCHGNYTAECKAHVFRFPRYDELLMKWIRAIPRQDFCPTRNSRVCEAHFSPEDILRETSYLDDASGQTGMASLPYPRLRKNAVSSRFPDCPTYLSTESATRDSPDTNRIRLAALAMQRALAESAETFRQDEEADKIVRTEDIVAHITLIKSTFWYTIPSNERIILLHIVEHEAPSIKYSATIKVDLVLTFHFMKCLTTKLGSILFVPPVAKSKRELSRWRPEMGQPA